MADSDHSRHARNAITITTDPNLLLEYRACSVLFGVPRETNHQDDWGDQCTVSARLARRSPLGGSFAVYCGLHIVGPTPGHVVLVKRKDYVARQNCEILAGGAGNAPSPYDFAVVYKDPADMHDDWILEDVCHGNSETGLIENKFRVIPKNEVDFGDFGIGREK